MPALTLAVGAVHLLHHKSRTYFEDMSSRLLVFLHHRFRASRPPTDGQIEATPSAPRFDGMSRSCCSRWATQLAQDSLLDCAGSQTCMICARPPRAGARMSYVLVAMQ